jgi:hypothetical protein
MKRLACMLALACAAVGLAADAAHEPKSLSTQAGGATLIMSTPDATIRTGQPLVVDITVDRPADVSVMVPAIKSPLGVWDIRKAESLPASKELPDRITERLTLVTFESGEQRVPSLTFTLRATDGKETSLSSPELPISVSSLLTDGYDPSNIRDVKGTVDIPLEARWPWIIGFAVLAGVLAWLGFSWWKGRSARTAPPEPVHVRAMRELDALAAQQLPQKGMVLDFYVLLSDTVRRYVEGRFGIKAPEQTTKEFLQAARFHPAIRDDHQRMLAAFLRAADMVKFAAQRPGPAECDRGLDAARGFVRESTPAAGADELTPGGATPHEGQESVR